MITNIPNDEIFIHSKNNNDKELMNVNDNYISHELKINNFLSEKQVSYSSYSVICENLYNDIKNKSKISNYIIGLLLESSHVVNSTIYKTIVLTRLLEQTKSFKIFF